MKKIKIALAPIEFINNNIEYNLKQIEKSMIKAKSEKANLICFGESFVQGFDSLSWEFEKDKYIALSQSSEVMNKIKQFTCEIGIDLLIGYLELVEEVIYSSYALISNGKIIHNHRRISKGWKEISIADEHYQEGTNVQIIKYKSINLVVALCGELWDYKENFILNEDLLIWGIYCNYSLEEWKKEKVEYTMFASTICNNVAIINSISHDIDSYGGAWYIENGQIKNSIDFNINDLLFIEYIK